MSRKGGGENDRKHAMNRDAAKAKMDSKRAEWQELATSPIRGPGHSDKVNKAKKAYEAAMRDYFSKSEPHAIKGERR